MDRSLKVGPQKVCMKLVCMLFTAMLGIHSSFAQANAPLTVVETWSLPGVTGKFDHLAVDLSKQRLFVAATGNHSVEVISLSTGRVEQSITGLGKPHGLIWDDAAHKLYVADGDRAKLLAYTDGPTSRLTLAGELKLSDDADDMTFNSAKHLLFVGHGGSDAANPARIAVVDTESFKIKANLEVATHPEALDIDVDGSRIFANIADANAVAVLDGNGKAVSNTWKLTDAGHNVPMVYDSQDHLLFVACRKPAVLLTLDATTGKELSRAPAGEGADDLFYDSQQHRVYVISGSGEIDAYQVNTTGSLPQAAVIPTSPGAKTGLLVPSLSRLYLAVPGTDGKPAELRVYSTKQK